MGRLLNFIIVLLFLSCQTTEQKDSSSNPVQLEKVLDSLVNSYYQSGQFSGSVLVSKKGDVIYHEQFGYRDLDSTKLIGEESVFEIASLSKQFTATLIMMLKESGQINYDDALVDYFPGFPYDDITIRHLLTHTSGLSERAFFMWARENMKPPKIYHNESILEYLKSEKPELAFQPGSGWEYSNVGYFLLPLIIKHVTGKHYIDVLNEKIISPLDMQKTGIFSQEYKGSQMEDYVFGKVFNPRDSMFMSAFGLAWSDSLYGGVGILSTASDLFKWDQALYSDKFLSAEALAEAFKPFPISNDSSSQYGFGWYVKDNFTLDDTNYGKRLDHNGLWPGYESSIVRYVDERSSIIILANQAPSAKDRMVEEISNVLLTYE